MTSTGYIGVDPGASGGIGVLWVDQVTDIVLPEAHSIPYVGGEVDIWALDALLTEITMRGRVAKIAIEKQQTFGISEKAGKGRVFVMGQNYGMLRAVFQLREIPVFLPSPAAWKAAAKLSSDKEAARAKALQRWPTAAAMLSRKMDEGRAEALWIAEWARLSA